MSFDFWGYVHLFLLLLKIVGSKMINLMRNLEKLALRKVEKHILATYSTAPESKHEEFLALNIRAGKDSAQFKKTLRKSPIFPPREKQMAVNQDWGSVWPGPRSFHPASVPLPVRQGYTKKGAPAPGKYANAELMKIPNFLHLTPPVIKRQCEALKKFCTPWPSGLDTQENIETHFPIEVTTSDYCHSSPTIRDHMARIVTVRFKVASLGLSDRARDKFLRLVGERYNKENDTVTIVTDRCPLKKQNYDYAMYLVTALYHESNKIEPWEELKTEADMEYYDWGTNVSKKSIEAIFNKDSSEIPHSMEYSAAVVSYMNDGEDEYTISKYKEAVKKLLNLPAAS
ncbi:28S ribosomal protein S35, mitochondrial [Anthonomus grandis grandis]|uniref:28S ribosomal protein S35, mitochondrial n=1 Tax=Anthonomus grandis grandis TaxID=2921223 RepID=UPI00216663C1|nr:28S ribosomal protein S35, mitochondrial [Anthonomus grandis grandis]